MNELEFWKLDPEAVFENLELNQVKVDLEDGDRSSAISAIEKALEKVPKDGNEYWSRLVLTRILQAIRQKLLNSKEINVEMIKKVVDYYIGVPCEPNVDPSDDIDYYKIFHPSEFESESEDGGESEGEVEGMEMDDESDGEREDSSFGLDLYEAEKPSQDMDEELITYNRSYWLEDQDPYTYKTAAWDELEKQCSLMGYALNKSEKDLIIKEMMSFFTAKGYRTFDDSDMRVFVDYFMSRYAQVYMLTTCILNDLNTVLNAVTDVEKQMENGVHQLLEKNNIIPTDTKKGIECSQQEQERNLPHTDTIRDISENFLNNVQLEG